MEGLDPRRGALIAYHLVVVLDRPLLQVLDGRCQDRLAAARGAGNAEHAAGGYTVLEHAIQRCDTGGDPLLQCRKHARGPGKHGLDPGEHRQAFGRDVLAELAGLGIVERRGRRLVVPERHWPLLRLVAAAFDRYLGAGPASHAPAV